MIEIETNSVQTAIREIQRKYSNLQGDILHQAISRTLNRAASQSRTSANKNIRQVYNISAARINSELKTRNSTARSMTAAVYASGSPLSLNNFKPVQQKGQETIKFDRKGNLSRVTRATRRKNPVSGVSFEIKKGNVERVATAFIQTSNGGTTVFARGSYIGAGQGFEFSKARLPIAALTTTSIPLMFANNDVMQPTEKTALEVIKARIDHEINWLTRR